MSSAPQDVQTPAPVEGRHGPAAPADPVVLDTPRPPPTRRRSVACEVLALCADPATATLLIQVFQAPRFALRVVQKGDSFAGELKRLPPGLVLVDLELDADAVGAIQATRAQPLTVQIPVFALASPQAGRTVVAAVTAGVSEVLQKPLLPIPFTHRVHQALREHEAMQTWRRDLARRRHIDAANPDLSVLVDTQGKILEIITVGRVPSMGSPERFVGRLVDDWLRRPEEATLSALCTTAIRGGGEYQIAIDIDGLGGPTTIDFAIAAAGPGRALLVAREIDARQLGYEKNPVSTSSRFDVLTGLPNRQAFVQRLDDRLPKQGVDHKVAVFRINLLQFAEIGNLLGTDAAEGLLKGLAERLLALTEQGSSLGASLLGTMASIGRIDADALGVITSGVRSRSDCLKVVERLRRLLEQPVEYRGRELRSKFSIGISVAPGDGLEAETLLRAAGVAAAAASADDEAVMFSKELHAQSLRRLDLEAQLRKALEVRELSLAYQPKVDLRTHMVTGFEALLRWHSAVFGSISPAEIIPLAEQTGLIAKLGEWVLEQACADLASWRTAGFPGISVAVNVSAEQFHTSDVGAVAMRALGQASLPPAALELELTESCLLRDRRGAATLFGALRDRGLRLSIDDFGTGYSSLQYLRHLPVHALKIDRSFVKDLPGDNGALAICRAVVALGRSLDLEVVAEGVETLAQLQSVAAQGSTQAQGYLVAKPMPAGEVIPWLTAGSWRTLLADVKAVDTGFHQPMTREERATETAILAMPAPRP